jgi:hypothetical protein
MCSKSPFLLDLWVAGLAQLGQTEDLLKIDMAYTSGSRAGSILYIQIVHENRLNVETLERWERTSERPGRDLRSSTALELRLLG